MIIEVTQDDIANGFPGNASGCPIHRALERAGFENTVTHTYCTIYNQTPSGFMQVDLPPNAQGFVRAFDERIPVAPFRFDLPLEELEC